jgi:hypothetical protein
LPGRVSNDRARRTNIKIEGLNAMSEFQTSTDACDYRRRDSAHLVAVGDGVKRARQSLQAERHEILHEAVIITVTFLICVVAICIMLGPTLPSSPDALPMANWPPGSI